MYTLAEVTLLGGYYVDVTDDSDGGDNEFVDERPSSSPSLSVSPGAAG